MNRQEHKTTCADMSGMMIGLQLDNLILTPNLKPKTTSHNQGRLFLKFLISLPLSVEDLCHYLNSRINFVPAIATKLGEKLAYCRDNR